MQGNFLPYPSRAMVERPTPPWRRTYNKNGVHKVPHDAQTSGKDKRAFLEPEADKDIFIQGDKPGIGQVVYLSLNEEML